MASGRLRLGDQAHDPGQGGLLAYRRDADSQASTECNRPGDDPRARLFRHRSGLAGDHGLIDLGVSSDDLAIGRNPGARTDQQQVANSHCTQRDAFRPAIGQALGGVREEVGEGRERTLGLHDRTHLDPVPQAHHRDQAGQLPPDVDAEEPKRGSPRSDECHQDRQTDEGHHPGPAL